MSKKKARSFIVVSNWPTSLVKDFSDIEKVLNRKFRSVMLSIQVGENLLLDLDYDGFEMVLLKVTDKTWIASCHDSDVRCMIECDVIELE